MVQSHWPIELLFLSLLLFNRLRSLTTVDAATRTEKETGRHAQIFPLNTFSPLGYRKAKNQYTIDTHLFSTYNRNINDEYQTALSHCNNAEHDDDSHLALYTQRHFSNWSTPARCICRSIKRWSAVCTLFIEQSDRYVCIEVTGDKECFFLDISASF